MLTFHRLRPLAVGLIIACVPGAVFLAALTMPIPTAGDARLDEVIDEVEGRLPGWRVVRADESWENAYTVVAVCDELEVGFQVIPARGMQPGDAFIVPNDRFSRSRLRLVADDARHLFWRAGSEVDRPLRCDEELTGDRGPDVNRPIQ